MLPWLSLVSTWTFLLVSPTALSTSPDLLLVPRDAPVSSVPLRLWANPRQAALRPRKRDLHQTALLAMLQPHFDSEWMSLTKPHRPPWDLSEPRNSIVELEKKANALPLSEPIKEWLVSRANCPIGYEWRDLGSDFWPRWVRIAVCLKPVLGTCSWPPGMSCVPGPPRHLYVLRWHCREGQEQKKKNKGRRRKYRCLWVKVPYPVPQDCVCACS